MDLLVIVAGKLGHLLKWIMQLFHIRRRKEIGSHLIGGSLSFVSNSPDT
ncbi:hypothetical protein [Bacillus weihaiensis]|nr:hypothetical protein [Bacillus weihaiensis]